MKAMQKQRPYMLRHSFIIKTNQQALKYLLEQKVKTEKKQKWLAKLLGYSFTIEYKRGQENKVANALSQKGEFGKDEGSIAAIITFSPPDWIEELKSSYAKNHK